MDNPPIAHADSMASKGPGQTAIRLENDPKGNRMEHRFDRFEEWEAEFGDKPTHIDSVLIEDEGEKSVVGVYIKNGWVDLPVSMFDRDDDEKDFFVLVLSPREARDLAGILNYAAGRASETREFIQGEK